MQVVTNLHVPVCQPRLQSPALQPWFWAPQAPALFFSKPRFCSLKPPHSFVVLSAQSALKLSLHSQIPMSVDSWLGGAILRVHHSYFLPPKPFAWATTSWSSRDLELNLRSHQDQIVRREIRVLLTEREVGFLQLEALLVGVFVLYGILTDNNFCFTQWHWLASCVLDETKTQRIHQLETLLQENKSTNDQHCTEIDALDGISLSLGGGRTWTVSLSSWSERWNSRRATCSSEYPLPFH